MRVCEFAKLMGGPCEDGFSKLVLCQKDNVIRCLKECMRICPPGAYRARDVVQGTAVAGRRTSVSGGVSFSAKPSGQLSGGVSFSAKPSGQLSGGCGSPCGQNQVPETVQNRSW